MLASLLLHLVSVALIVVCILGLIGGSTLRLTATCVEGGYRWSDFKLSFLFHNELMQETFSSTTCLNNNYLFVVCSGSFLGFCLWLEFNFQNGNVLDFPLILESGNAQLRSSFKHLMRASSVNVIYNIKWFYFIYFSLGNLP